MPTDRELMQQALDALQIEADGWELPPKQTKEAIEALRARLAQPEPEPKVEREQSTTVAEREKVAKWMVKHGYATGHGDTIEDLLAELDWQIAENWNRAMINGIETEREACAKVCEGYIGADPIAEVIRARGQDV